MHVLIKLMLAIVYSLSYMVLSNSYMHFSLNRSSVFAHKLQLQQQSASEMGVRTRRIRAAI